MQEIWLKIVTKAWHEPAFKAELLANTNEVLKRYDVVIPPGVTYETLEDGVGGKHFLILPPEPKGGDLDIDNFGRNVQSGDPGF